MGLLDHKFNESDFYGKEISNLSDTPSSDGMTAEALKAYFDYIPKMIIALGSFNDLIDALVNLGIDNATVSLGDGSFKYIRLNTDGQLEVSNDGITYEVTASSGHIIIDGNGNQMAQRSRLKFEGVEIADDGTNTVITGIKGDKGDKGEQGDRGETGATGETGPRGATGPVIVPSVNSVGIISWELQNEPIVPSPMNIRGPQGVQGVQGAQGVQGERGPQGIQGPAGAQGIQGKQGPQGIQGATGAAGAVGPQGPTGAQGPAGAAGKDGKNLFIEDVYSTLAALRNALPEGNDKMYMLESDGECYIWSEINNDWVSVGKLQGATGPQGPQGPQGIQGETGPQGPQGEQGIQGIQGPQGIQGETGPQGATGPQGVAGTNGTDGKSAFASAVDGGFTGTEAQFNAYLGNINKMQSTDNLVTTLSGADNTHYPSAKAVDDAKVDKVAGKGLSTNDYTDTDKGKVDNIPSNTNEALGNKVDKADGKGLSTNDYTNTEKAKLSNLNTATIIQNNVSVATSAWVSNGIYTNYPCRATIPITGCTAKHLPDVTFDIANAISGDFCPMAETYDGGVYIYANIIPTEAITIPTIKLTKVVS